MATTLSSTTGTMNTPTKTQILLSHNTPKILSIASSSSQFHPSLRTPFSPSLLSGPKLHRTVRPTAASSGPPPPRRQPDPPPQKGLISFEGLTGTLSKIQDSSRIFFAVFFWLSLFFWASAWDGRNKGRPDKGPRDRR